MTDTTAPQLPVQAVPEVSPTAAVGEGTTPAGVVRHRSPSSWPPRP
jgi:hypothetical protein